MAPSQDDARKLYRTEQWKKLKKLKRNREFDLVAFEEIPVSLATNPGVRYLFRQREVFDWVTLVPFYSFIQGFKEQLVWRTNMWMVPGLVIFCMFFIFCLAEIIDYNRYKGSTPKVQFIVDDGATSDSVSLLNALISSIVTSFGLVLTVIITVLTGVLTLFGPRVQRRFMRDREIQVSTGIIAGTIITGILTMLSVNSGSEDVEAFTPWVTTWLIVLYSFLSLWKMVYFIQYYAELILVNNVYEGIIVDSVSVIEEMYSHMGQTDKTTMVEPFSAEWYRRKVAHENRPCLVYPIFAHESGYVKYISWRPIIAAARSANVCVFITKGSGRYIFKNSVIAYIQLYQENTIPSIHHVHAMDLAFRRYYRIGERRTMLQDPEFAVLQILEIGLRAMSPAVNDPFTMLAAVDFINEILCNLLRRGIYNHVHLDENDPDRPRLIEKVTPWTRILAAGMDPSRQVGPDSSTLMIRIVEALRGISFHLFAVDQFKDVLMQGRLVKETFLGKNPVSRDSRDLVRIYKSLLVALKENHNLYLKFKAEYPELAEEMELELDS